MKLYQIIRAGLGVAALVSFVSARLSEDKEVENNANLACFFSIAGLLVLSCCRYANYCDCLRVGSASVAPDLESNPLGLNNLATERNSLTHPTEEEVQNPNSEFPLNSVENAENLENAEDIKNEESLDAATSMEQDIKHNKIKYSLSGFFNKETQLNTEKSPLSVANLENFFASPIDLIPNSGNLNFPEEDEMGEERNQQISNGETHFVVSIRNS